ncbi:MAG TPA: YegP family protein [Steroidobacteraceae bacterium]|nr:YegP family protein [Steroidobacteraceae bacterium]HRX90034.1 YegP family protein [Steroidobacteraceae bacterium]
MAGYFQLKQSSSGQYMFNLKAGNHETILTSQLYSSKAAAEGGIEAVRKNAVTDTNFERKTASDGSPYFVLNSAANGQTVGKSEMYKSAAAMENGIASVKANASDAAVKEA